MSQQQTKKIGLLIGSEKDLPEALINTLNQSPDISAELVKIGGTKVEDTCPYHLIIDRISHDIPYYRAYVKFAAAQGTFIINNPFTWSADNKFFGAAITRKLGMHSPKTVILPNKYISKDVTVDTFRNLAYPLNWKSIIDYVGMPAILKDIISGGRPAVFRVHNEDELMERYDESGTRTMILQELIESDTHIHGFVIGQEDVMLLQYDPVNGRYLPTTITDKHPLYQQLTKASIALTTQYRYNINMVEFVIKDNIPYVINSTNPVPVIDKTLMNQEQFNWLIQAITKTVIDRIQHPRQQRAIIGFNETVTLID